MTNRNSLAIPAPGQSYRDRDGCRWWVKGPRPGGEGQFVVEVEVQGGYPRVDLYALTAREFQEHAQRLELKPERPSAR